MGVAIKFRWPGARDEEKGRRERRVRTPAGKKTAPAKRAPKQKHAVEARRKPRSQQAKGATRKVEVTRQKQPGNFQWLNRILILVGAGVVLIAATQAYITLQAIPVERITVKGELEHTQTEVIQDMVYPALSGGFLWADLAQVRSQLEALPWIHEASVRRVWPNALEIDVVEQLPIARWGEGAFLNHEGEVFRPRQKEAWQTLPKLSGPEGSAQSLMLAYQRLVDLLGPLGLSLSQLVIDDRGQMEATLAGGQRLVIGGADFLERMQRFKTVYRAELAADMDRVMSIDLRYERGVAVGFVEPVEETTVTSEKKQA